MDDRTGDLVPISDVFKKSLKEQKHFHEIPQSLMHEIEGMNRHQRRKWLALNRGRVEIELEKERSGKEDDGRLIC